MARVVVESPDLEPVELERAVRDLLMAYASFDWKVTVDRRPVQAPPAARASVAPSSRYTEETRGKMKAGRFDALTPVEVVAWWASRHLATFGEEDASLESARALPAHETAVRDALRRYHRETGQRSLLAYLNTALKWWEVRRRRQDRKCPGFPQLRRVLTDEWMISYYRSGDMKREVESAA